MSASIPDGVAKQDDRVRYAELKLAKMRECQLKLRDLIMSYESVFFGRYANSGIRLFEADNHLTREIESAEAWLKGEQKRLWWQKREAGLQQ